MSTVVIIEDDPGSAELLKAALNRIVHETLWAQNGREGLQMVSEIQPDLVFVDLRLPENFNGWDVIVEIRANHATQHIPVIVTAVETSPIDRTRAFEAGCNAFFDKPFNVHELREMVQHFLS